MQALADHTPEANEWLSQLYGTANHGWLTLFSYHRDQERDRITDWAPVDQIDMLAATAAHRATTGDVWFGVATRREKLASGRRGGGGDCLQIPGLWLDVDVDSPNHKDVTNLPPSIEAGLELIADFGVPPTTIIHTGGGLQPWWLFDEMLDADAAQNLLRSWGATWGRLSADRGWHLDNVFDIARIMRLPGTWNRKNEPTPVRIIERWTT